MVFCIAAAFCAIGMITYLLFASDQIQAWAKTEEQQEQFQKESLNAVEENCLLSVTNERAERV